MFDDICIFIAIINCGNFSIAARKLNISQSTLSKKITALETMLGSKLINRDSRNFNLTNDGKVFYDAFCHLEENVKQKLQNVIEHKPVQYLNLLLPSCLINHPISNNIMSILEFEPNIKTQVVYRNLMDLTQNNVFYDLALLSKFEQFHQAQQNLVFSTKNILITHASNVNKVNTNIECLNDISVVVYGYACNHQIEICHQNLQKNISFMPRQVICVDNIEEIKQFINNNRSAVAIVPESMVWKQFSDSEVKQTLVEYYCGYTQYILYLNDKNISSSLGVERVLGEIVQLIKESLFY